MSRKISFENIINTIADKNNLTKTFAHSFVKEIAIIIERGLLQDNVVTLAGLGIFKLHNVPERPGRNIQTGEAITIPAHRKVMFKPEKKLRELINKNYQELQPIIIGKEPKKKEPDNKPANEENNKFEAFLNKRLDEFEAFSQKDPEPEQKVKPEDEQPETNIFSDTARNSEPKKDDENENRKSNKAPVLYSLIAILIIIFLFIYFNSGEDAPSVPITEKDPDITTSEILEKSNAPPPVKENAGLTKLKTEAHATIKGDNLWNLAYKYYNNGYLWPLIYEANKSIISNPDLLEPGVVIEVPVINGRVPDKALARGHVLAYNAYKEKDKKSALNHLFVANKYDPEYIKNSIRDIDNSDLETIKNLSMK
jgi:nucleoid DNA-binding protein/nucleoid-associated protein YgaU